MKQNLFTLQSLRKVPEITLIFWTIKILTTAMGESTSDFLVYQINPVIAVALGAIGLVIALILQFFVRKYIPWIYWLAIVMVAIFGTMAADVLHIGLGIPYSISSLFFAISLTIIFFIWYRLEKTLSIHSIVTVRREIFYWATVMATFAMGTALGDLTATTFHLGYLLSGILFMILFLLPVIAYKFFKANEVLTFWIAYILTRPLGASYADWLGKPSTVGGLGLGDGVISTILLIVIIIFISYITVKDKKISATKKI